MESPPLSRLSHRERYGPLIVSALGSAVLLASSHHLAMQEFAEGSADPVAALGQNGVFAPESAVHYLTPGQLAEVAGDMEDMEESLSYEVTAWVLMDKLGRARRANDRMPVPRS